MGVIYRYDNNKSIKNIRGDVNMKRNLSKFKKVIATLSVASILVACGGGGGSATTDISEAKLGFIGPLSGDASQYGIAVKNAIELAINEYNDENDTNITAVYLDDKADATEGVNAYNKLVTEEGVNAIIGSVTSGSALAVVATAEADGIPILTPSGSADQITINDEGETYENVFRICTNDSYAGTFLAKKCNTDFNYKKVAILSNKDSDYSTGLRDAFVEEAKNQNVEVVFDETYTKDTKDYSTYISKLKNEEYDTIFLPDYYEQVVTIVQQFRDAGINTPLLGADGWDGVLGVSGVDGNIFNGSYYTSGFDKNSSDENVQRFVKNYTDKYKTEPNMFAAFAYGAVFVMMDAMERAGTTESSKVNEALADTNYKNGVAGAFKYDKKHNPIKEMVIVGFENGKYVTNSN